MPLVNDGRLTGTWEATVSRKSSRRTRATRLRCLYFRLRTREAFIKSLLFSAPTLSCGHLTTYPRAPTAKRHCFSPLQWPRRQKTLAIIGFFFSSDAAQKKKLEYRSIWRLNNTHETTARLTTVYTGKRRHRERKRSKNWLSISAGDLLFSSEREVIISGETSR